MRHQLDLITVSLPYSFITNKARLTWREVLFGLDNALMEPGTPSEIAAAQLAHNKGSTSALVDLAGLGRDDAARPCIETLANAEPEEDLEEIRDKWLYLVLAWLFEHKESLADPLQRVEEVYADFNYPERIAGFVRYMPCDEPDLGSRVLNEQRLLDRWKKYLEEASRRYASF